MAFKKDRNHEYPGLVGIDLGSQSTRCSLSYTRKSGESEVERVTVSILPEVPVSTKNRFTIVGNKEQPYTSGPTTPFPVVFIFSPVIRSRSLSFIENNLGKHCHVSLTTSNRANMARKRFNTRLNLSLDTEPYSRYEGIMSPDSVTMKPGIAFLVGESDDELHDSPIWGVFKETIDLGPRHQDTVRRRIKQAMIMLFEYMFEHLQRECDLQGVYVTTITLTVPVKWFKLDYIDVYNDALHAGFLLDKLEEVQTTAGKAGSASPKVHFLTESESYFHYIFSDEISRRTIIQKFMMDRKNCLFILLDMGGFNASISAYVVARKDDWERRTYNEDELCFLQIGHPKGAYGGSAHWNYRFQQHCVKEFPYLATAAFKKQLQDLTDQFEYLKYTMSSTQEVGFSTSHNDKGWTNFYLPGYENKRMFDESHKKALDLVSLGLCDREVRTRKLDAVLIVAGLSARHQYAKAGIEERWCREGCSTRKIIYTCDTNENQVMHPSTRLSRGSVFAEGKRTTVLEYIDHGGLWGIQKTTKVDRYTQDFEPSATLIFSKTRRQETVRISSKLKFSVRLIGTPFTLSDDTIDTRKKPCYEHLEFEGFDPGTYKFSMSVNGKTNELRIDCIKGSRRAIFQAEVYYHVGQNCVLCVEDIEAILVREREFVETLCGDDPTFVPDNLKQMDHQQVGSARMELRCKPDSPGSTSSCTIQGDTPSTGSTPASRQKSTQPIRFRRLDSDFRSISQLWNRVSKHKSPGNRIRRGTVSRDWTPALDDQLRAESSSSAGPSYIRGSHAATPSQSLSVVSASHMGRTPTERRSVSVAPSASSFIWRGH